jgi:large subunit ribosomal protein L21
MTFENVLMIVDGEKVQIGAPYVKGATVEAKVIEHGRGDKIRVVKAHRRKRYRRVKGHRQDHTSIEVTGIKA